MTHLFHVPFHNYYPRFLWSASWFRPLHFQDRATLHPVTVILPLHMSKPSQPVLFHHRSHRLYTHPFSFPSDGINCSGDGERTRCCCRILKPQSLRGSVGGLRVLS